MSLVYSQNYTVRNYELGPHQAVHVRSLLDYFQETADSHIRNLGVSVQDLLKKGFLWVLALYRLEIYRYPGEGETITVNTWYPGRDGRFYLRDFEVLDSDGEPVAAATSSWVVLDERTRRPVETTEALPDIPILEKREIKEGFEHITEVDEPGNNTIITVGASCLDMYQHVNHVNYIQWALDTVNPGIESGALPWSIEAVFKAEALAGDRLNAAVQSGEADQEWLHSISREGDGVEVARLRTKWRKSVEDFTQAPM